MMTRAWLALVGLAVAALPHAATAQAFDNTSVVALHDAGLGDTAIIAKIDAMPCTYDVSIEQLIALKRQGLSDAIIAAMLRRCTAASRAQGVATESADPAVPREPGIYALQDWAVPRRMAVLRPTKVGSVKITGNGSILFPYVAWLVVPGAASGTVVQAARPTFYFYFSPDDRRVSDFGLSSPATAQSPDEFSLVRFKSKDAARRVLFGKVSVLSARRGIDPKAALPFTSEEVGDSVFKVTVADPLPAGEYGFVITGSDNTARVYDFSIP